MKYGNITTQEIQDSLPSVLVTNGATITGATLQNYLSAGWRLVSSVEAIPDGFRAAGWVVNPLNDTQCTITASSLINIADEVAAQAAAQLAADKDAAKVMTELGTSAYGRAIRALAELSLDQINVLRGKVSLAAITKQQFVDALKSKIDAQ